jgi:hypothetical protein
VVVPFPGTLDMILGLVFGAESRDVVGEGVVLDPFLNKTLGVVAELTVVREFGDPIEPGDEELRFVPLPKGAVAAPVVLIVTEVFVDPVGAGELPDPLLDGEAVFGMLAVDVGIDIVLEDVGLGELRAAAVLANNDRRFPA